MKVILLCLVVVATAFAAPSSSRRTSVDKKVVKKEYVSYDKQYVYHGKYSGKDNKCDKDGFYYRNENSFVICSNNNAYVQPCADGSRNSAYDRYTYGSNYYYRDFCDINLVNRGYGARGYDDKSYGGYDDRSYGYDNDKSYERKDYGKQTYSRKEYGYETKDYKDEGRYGSYDRDYNRGYDNRGYHGDDYNRGYDNRGYGADYNRGYDNRGYGSRAGYERDYGKYEAGYERREYKDDGYGYDRYDNDRYDNDGYGRGYDNDRYAYGRSYERSYGRKDDGFRRGYNGRGY